MPLIKDSFYEVGDVEEAEIILYFDAKLFFL